MNICEFENCGRNKVRGGKFCRSHYRRLSSQSSADIRIAKYSDSDICEINECSSRPMANNLCRKHYLRKYVHGSAEVTLRAENGSGYIDSNGYRWISINGNKMLEHRYVMEQKLGRALRKGENVHHKNGNRSDNSLSNLELWSTSQPPGQRVEDKVRWAKEILDLYGEEFRVSYDDA
jgi:hypothetical protein